MAGNAEERDSCARCFQRLPVDRQTSGVYVSVRCAVCGYRNVTGATGAIAVPLAEMLHHVGLNAQAVLGGCVGGADVFDRCLRAMAEPVQQLLGNDPELQGAATLIALHQHRDDATTPEDERGEQTLYRSASSRVVTLLYLETLRRTVFDLDAAERAVPRADMQAFWQQVHGPLSDVAVLGSYRLATLQGQHEVTLDDDGVARLGVSRTNLAYVEWAWNRPPKGLTSDDAQWLVNVAEAVKLHRGFGPLDVIRCVGRRDPQKRPRWLAAAGHSPDDVVALQGHSVTRARVESLAWPWFYDLAPSCARRDDGEVLFAAATHNWLAYFPLLPARSGGGDGFLTLDLWMDVFTNNLVSSKSRLLEEICHRPQDTVAGDHGRAHLRRLRSTLNRELEQRVAGVLRDAGWTTRPAGTHRAAGEREEIDVLASRLTADGVLVFVIEAKDFDFRLSAARGPENMQDRATAAQAQVARKAAFVTRHPAILETVFGPSAPAVTPPTVLPLIVTREELPLAMFRRVHAVSVNSLPKLLEDLRDSPALVLDVLRRGTAME
jgi:hypothetical protein